MPESFILSRYSEDSDLNAGFISTGGSGRHLVLSYSVWYSLIRRTEIILFIYIQKRRSS